MALAVSAMAVSCRESYTPGKPVVGYLARVLADTTAREYSLVKAYDKYSDEGGLFIIGAPEDVLLMGEEFLTSDRYNNINGAVKTDELPDFAGETINPVADMANYPYEDYIKLSNKDLLREITLANFLFAMDTTCLLSPFDTLHPVRKAGAKAVVLASTYSCIYGYSEIDSLCRRANNSVAVISVLDEMIDQALDSGHEAVIWTTRERLESGVWNDFFKAGNGMGYTERRIARGLSDPSDKWSAYSPVLDSLSEEESLRGLLLDLLDDWQEAVPSGNRLASVVLDDPTINPVDLQAVIDALINTDDDYMLHYRNLLSTTCKCIWSADAAARRCYEVLRERNSFTHRIAFPVVKCYASAASASLPKTKYDLDGSFSYSFKYNRENWPVEKSYTFVELREKYMTGNLAAFMKQRTPQTYSQYVR